MKSKFKLISLSLMMLGITTGCVGGGNSTSSGPESLTSSSSSSSSNSSSSGTSTSQEPAGYVSLNQAIDNTSTYGITAESRLEDGWYIEVMLDDFFYYSPANTGYIILEEDPNYFHVVTQSQIEGADTISYDLNVHGRNGRASDFTAAYSSGSFMSFIAIMEKYEDDFFKIDENTYSSSVASIGDDLEVYFQTHSLTYTNYFEVDINKEGRLDRFRTYEIDGTYKTETMEIVIASLKLEDYIPYQRWNAAGRNTDVRIYDLKFGYMGASQYVSVYENETMEVEGVATSIDTKGNYYIAKEDSLNGYVGIRVVPNTAGSVPSIGQTVTVTGTIKSNDFMVYLDQGEFEVTGSDAKYLPIFDEETVADNYGGGAYAYQMFCYAPYFADSVYSTFAYVYDAPSTNAEGQDTIITLACPNVDTNIVFYMRLILPKELDSQTRDNILEEINAHGKFTLIDNQAEELSIQNTLVRFNNNYNYKVELEVTAESAVSKRPSPQEKIETVVGLSNFPIPSVGGSCFRFGGATGLFIESYYGKDTTDTLGVYLNSTNVSMNTINSYLGEVEAYGFTKVEEQMDIYNGRHSIYKYGDVVFDIWVSQGMSEEYDYYIWIYEGEVVRYKSIQDKISESIGNWFDVDDFVKLIGTYDADYNYYELLNFAGQDFTSDDPLRCITLDLNTDRFAELREQYRALGFGQSRNTQGGIYTYITRGSVHYVYEKSSGTGNEKIYIDMAMYPTTDYTYSGHSNFTNRIEVMIYKAEAPLATVFTDSMVEFSNEVVEKYGEQARLYANLPENSRVELVKGLGRFTQYGYNYNDEAFVYGNSLDEIESALVEGLTFSGYQYLYSGSRANVYAKNVTDPSAAYMTYCYIFIMKEPTRGYVRVANSLAGVDF